LEVISSLKDINIIVGGAERCTV